MKRRLYGVGLLMLLLIPISVALALKGWEPIESFSGLMIMIFLVYCLVVILVQVFSALVALRSFLEHLTKKEKTSRRIPLR